MKTFALVDCNNFFASCERIFNPKLEGKPIVVLSNNDGCIIARSQEAKKLGIPMGAPYYQWRALCQKNNVHVFSSNFELYGDISDRIMTALTLLCQDIEIYSIDEAFLTFDDLTLIEAKHIRKTLKTWIGIPVSIGIAPTKTLAKIANAIAKKQTQEGVFDLRNPKICDALLSQFPIEDIWGIGKQLAKRLKSLNIHTAKELRDANLKTLRKQFSVVMERMIQELRGISCLALESVQPRKQIITSRSFGKSVTTLPELQEALSHYTARACFKLRRQQSLAHGICVFLRTGFFNAKETQYQNSLVYYFSEPSADTRYILSIAKTCLEKIFKPEFKYHKTGIILLDLIPDHIQQFNLLADRDPIKSKLVMKTLDQINGQMGDNTLFFGAEGITREWRIKCDRRSPRYTTCWKELAIVHSS